MTSPVNEISAGGGTGLERPEPRHRVEKALDGLPVGGEGRDDGSGDALPHQGELVAPVQQINEVMRPYGVEFELSESPSRVVTRLVERDTGELIRQIPAEEILRIAEHLEELRGRLIDLQA